MSSRALSRTGVSGVVGYAIACGGSEVASKPSVAPLYPIVLGGMETMRPITVQ